MKSLGKIEAWIFVGIFHISLAKYEDICGLENRPLEDKIIGGDEAHPNQFPWIVAIKAHKAQDQWRCTGSIVDDNWILTAAHCINSAKEFEIFAGSHDISLSDEPYRQYFKTNRSYKHPAYVSAPFQVRNDLGLIQLNERIEFNERVRPICLPENTHDNYAGKRATIAGWGLVRGEPDPITLTRLRFAKRVKIVKNSFCRHFYGLMINNRIICTDTLDEKAFCNGDSGGPLNYEISDGKYVQIGVANFAGSLSCFSGRPQGYARMNKFLKWIKKMTGR